MGDESPVTVLVVDDQPRFRDLACTVVGRTPGFAVVGEAFDGAAAVESVRRLRPALVLMDVHMPVLDGIGAAAAIRAEWPDTVVVLVSSDARDDLPTAVRSSGAQYLHKEELDTATIRRAWDERNVAPA